MEHVLLLQNVQTKEELLVEIVQQGIITSLKEIDQANQTFWTYKKLKKIQKENISYLK